MKLNQSLSATRNAFQDMLYSHPQFDSFMERKVNAILENDAISDVKIALRYALWYCLPSRLRHQLISMSFDESEIIGGYAPATDSHIDTLLKHVVPDHLVDRMIADYRK